MKNISVTKRICRAGVIAALYVALTYAFGAIAYNGVLQIRPAEALTVLPLIFPEAVPALYVGCIISNLASPFVLFDIGIGGFATLIAATATWFVGKIIKNDALKIIIGGIFPVLVNAFIIPLIIVFLCNDFCGYETATIAYWVNFGSLCLTQGLWVYGLGTPLYFAVTGLRKRGIAAFTDGRKVSREKTALCQDTEESNNGN